MHLQEYTDCFANNISVPGKTVREKSLIESEKNINNKIKNCTGRSGSEIIKVTKPKSAWGLISQGKKQNQPKKPNKKTPKLNHFLLMSSRSASLPTPHPHPQPQTNTNQHFRVSTGGHFEENVFLSEVFYFSLYPLLRGPA